MRGRRAPMGGRTGGPGISGTNPDVLNAALASFSGVARSLNKKKILLEISEEQTLTMLVTKKTLFFVGDKAATFKDVPQGSKVNVDAKKEVTGDLVAVNISLVDAGAEKTEADLKKR